MSKDSGLNILVVDDEEIVRYTLKAFLVRLGSRVAVAKDGMTGLEALQKEVYHAAFIDYRMPGLDGIDLLRRIREIRPDIRLIIISGHASAETQKEAIQEGAFTFLQKPFTFNSVKEIIATIYAFQNP